MSKRIQLLTYLSLIALALISCSRGGPDRGAVSGPAGLADEPVGLEPASSLAVDFLSYDEEDLGEEGAPPFVLSEGQPEWVGVGSRPPLAVAAPLSHEQIRAVLERLPPVRSEEGDVGRVRLPEQTLPPPRPGHEVELPFPPPRSEEPPEDFSNTPLRILRFSPEGSVSLATGPSLTFNQPMVPLDSQTELAQEDLPVKLSPAVPGRWRWVGAKTLSFAPDVDGADRMPMATEYTVEVSSGAASLGGQRMGEDVSWTFRTPAPTLQKAYPTGGPVGPSPVFFAAFDQRIDPSQVIAYAQVTALGRSFPLRLATKEEISGDHRVQGMAAAVSEERGLAFVSTDPLPQDTTVTVTFAPGTPSVEGPLVTAHPQSYSFQTRGAFALRQAECVWSGGTRCEPGEPWVLRFNNPIDTGAFDPSAITIVPDVAHVSYSVFRNEIWIEANARGNATYQVSVSSGLVDRFAQTLEEDATVNLQIGPSEAMLGAKDIGPLTVLDPYGTPAFPIYTVNVDAVRVRAFRVAPEDYVEYLQWLFGLHPANPQDSPGEQVMDRTMELRGQADEMLETVIDLTEALDGPTGHVILYIEPKLGLLNSLTNSRLRDMRVIRWVQVTRIGLDAFADAENIYVWVNRLADGEPLPGVDVSLWPQDVHGATDATGTTLLPLPGDSAQLLIARNDDDAAFLPENPYGFYKTDSGWSGWRQRDPEAEIRYYVFDDRKIYRPGENVSIKGWIRNVERRPAGGVTLLKDGDPVRLSYVARDRSSNLIHKGGVSLSSLGGFHLQFAIPENADLGYAYIAFQLRASGIEEDEAFHYHDFQIQEFRRPEFEVSARVGEGPHVAGEHALATVSAAYFAGGALPNAEVLWEVSARSGSYVPPNWTGFVFGKWAPWWRLEGEDGYLGRASFSSRTDSAGQHSLRIDFLTESAEEVATGLSGRSKAAPYPLRVDASATVIDVNRQAWSQSAGLLLHPADRYVGLRSEQLFVEQGSPLSVQVVVTDIDGRAISGHGARVRAARLSWEFHEGEWSEVEKDAQDCTVETTAASAPHDVEHPFSACTFDTGLGGEYRITATVVDGAGRRNRTQMTRWVSGGRLPPGALLRQEELQLIPDGESYSPGDSAQILVQSPFFPAEGVLTLRRDGLVSQERFTMDGPTHTLTVPIEAQYIPNIHLQVDLVGSAVRVDGEGTELDSAPPRPAYAGGLLNLSVPPLSRRLRVEAVPRARALEPGGETSIDVTVLDADGKPVADAEFAVVVVDEAILALTGYKLIDPLDVFYGGRQPGVTNYRNRANLLLATTQLQGVSPQPPSHAAMARGMGSAMAQSALDLEAAEDSVAGEDGAGAIRVRIDHNPLALFAPETRTDAHGEASVNVSLPDNLTRYRVMVVAASEGAFFGAGESSLTARLPLMVRPSAPRFLNFGDTFELPVVLQNQTDRPEETHIVVRAANAELTAVDAVDNVAGYAVTVPANDRVELRISAAAASAGTARFQFGAVNARQGYVADATELELPVYTPATTEAFAVYGEIDGSGAVLQPLRSPSLAVPDYGGLEVTLSSTALQALSDAFVYLVNYPYESTEQLASRILAIAALRDVLTAFDAEGLPSPAEIARVIESDLQTLRAMQDSGGGFPIWRPGGEVWPYHSVHAAHALARARQKGYPTPPAMVSASLDYLRNIEDRIPSSYSVSASRGLTSYALYVRKLLGDHDPAKARELVNEAGLGNLTLESIGWLLFALTGDPASQETVSSLRRFLNNRVSETAASATVATGYGDGDHLLLHSSRRTDAVILEALVADQQDSDLITKLARGLLAQRTAGRWNNTQENVWVLLAMDRYFAAFESETPDFVARMWLGDRYAGGRAFAGRSTDNVNLRVPMRYLQDASAAQDQEMRLVLQKEGQGRLYYRLGLRYAPADLRLDQADHGFTVARVYEAVDDPADVRRQEDGVWRIRAGARVRVKLTMVAPSRRVHVALIDPLPAGLEILNSDLAVTADAPRESNGDGRRIRWWGPWYQHQNLRDERAEAFTSYLEAGLYEYSYTARATTPGIFAAPPARAEEMYAPETYGRSETDTVIVEVVES